MLIYIQHKIFGNTQNECNNNNKMILLIKCTYRYILYKLRKYIILFVLMINKYDILYLSYKLSQCIYHNGVYSTLFFEVEFL